MTTTELWGSDRAGLMERLGRLAGQTTYREPGLCGGSPYSAQVMTTEAKLLLALKMGQTHEGDVGPWIVYSIALHIDDRKRQIVEWIANKLEHGAGQYGRRNAHRMLIIGMAAYDLAVHGIDPPEPKRNPGDFAHLASVGAGWIWMKCESTIERAIRAGKLTMSEDEIAA